jgi:hypothetical protein
MAKKRNEGGSIIIMRKPKRQQVIKLSFVSFDDIKAVRKLKRQGYVVSEINWDNAILTKGGK